MWAQVATAIQDGDMYIYAILVLSFIGMMFVFERIILLQFILNLDFKKFVTTVKKMIAAEDYDRALNFCKNASKTSLPRICMRAIEAAEKDLGSVKGVIEEETLDFLPRIEARVQVIPVFATLILFVGVLGTVDSLWTAFESIGVLDTAQKQASIGHGVANSLIYTAMGLVVSLFFVVAHQLIRGMAINLFDRLQHGVAAISNLLVPSEGMGGTVSMATGITPASHAELGVAPVHSSLAERADTVAQKVQSPQTVAEDDDAATIDIKDEEEII